MCRARGISKEKGESLVTILMLFFLRRFIHAYVVHPQGIALETSIAVTEEGIKKEGNKEAIGTSDCIVQRAVAFSYSEISEARQSFLL